MTKKDTIVVSDRYSATGKPRPDPATVCRGHCEGMGFHPIPPHKTAEIEQARADGRLHPNMPDEIGWYWATCGVCGGTGKRGTA